MHNQVHVMLDLETLGTGPNAVIVSIGACKFTLNDGPLEESDARFYCRVDIRSCVEAGLDVDADTVLWWLDQSPEAIQELVVKDGRLDLRTALVAFTDWMERRVPSKALVYSNGPSFDAVILAGAMKKFGMRPIEFCRERDHRTALDFLAFSSGKTSKEARDWLKGELGVVIHNALADAVRQAKGLHLQFGEKIAEAEKVD